MSSDSVNKWIIVAANLGVLIGIFLLIVELKKNREMMRAQSRADIAATIIDHMHTVSSDQELADIMRRARLGQDLDETESVRYLYHSLATIRNYENVHYQYRLGLFDREEFAGELNGFVRLLSGSVGLTRIWCQFRTIASTDFRIEVDAMIDDLDCD